jgi:iron complex transport system permease protein
MSTKLNLILLTCISALLLTPLIGIEFINPINMFRSNELIELYLQLRLPRSLTAFAVGSILALVGLIYQTCLQNPLASPFTLGISSAAALGASLAAWLGISGFLLNFLPFNAFFAFLFCLVFIAFLAIIARSAGDTSSSKLIIVGILLSYFLSSVLLFLQYLFDYSQLLEVTRWLMGSVVIYDYHQVFLLLISSLSLLILSFWKADDLDLMLLGSDTAQVRGLVVANSISFFVILTSIVLAISIAFCGPIGFIGIIIPHASKRLLSIEHHYTIFGSWLMGGTLLLVADMCARIVMPPYELPIGILTALIGTPLCAFFLIKNNYA